MAPAILFALVTAAIATGFFRAHYRKIHGTRLSGRASWAYAAAAFGLTVLLWYAAAMLMRTG